MDSHFLRPADGAIRAADLPERLQLLGPSLLDVSACCLPVVWRVLSLRCLLCVALPALCRVGCVLLGLLLRLRCASRAAAAEALLYSA